MAVETNRPGRAGSAREVISEGISGLSESTGNVRAHVRRVAAFVDGRLGPIRDFARRIRLYERLTTGPLVRFVTKSLLRRIIFANMIGLAVLLGGIFYMSKYHAWLIEAKVDSLKVQGEIIAAAIAANAQLDRETGRLVFIPELLPDADTTQPPPRDDIFTSLQLSIHPDRVTPILRHLVPSDIRARVYGDTGTLVVDSDQMLKSPRTNAVEQQQQQDQVRVKVKSPWTRFLSWLLRGDLPVYREIGGANGTAYWEVKVVLNGGPTTPMLLVTDKAEQIVSVAAPIFYRKAVQGVLLLSTRPGEIDGVLSEERNIILVLALTAIAATLLASLLLARTIAGPMRRLSAAAENVSYDINARHDLPDLTQRADEVGQMAGAFRGMTASLFQRLEESERFAQDVAHELKNPLTAARSTAEALAYAKTPEKQQELVRQVQEELKRLNKLITDVASAARVGTELVMESVEAADVRQVLRAVVAAFQDRLSTETRRVVLDIAPAPNDAEAFVVMCHEARLGRVITNLLDNAISFSPENGVVTVYARRIGREIEIVVDDEGPGIPPDMLEDVFARFYSYRPQTDSTIGKNSGLGLSISLEIVTAYGGRIWAANRMAESSKPAGAGEGDAHLALEDLRSRGIVGARFTVRLPAADRPPAKGAAPLGRRV
jgi:two-component system, OmpR family, sensor histidine kinase ChvG